MDNLVRTSQFISFDGGTRLSTTHQRPDRFAHLEAPEPDVARIARGGGYSYCAASFGADTLVQDMTAFNRFLGFDEQALLLTVEPGVRLSELLAWALPRRLYFPVLPGYPLITVGGCIATDVHGKNPYRDGTFSDWVRELTVFHPHKGYTDCSETVNPGLFRLTCGGYGLTGIITRVTLQLIPLPGAGLDTTTSPVEGLVPAREALARDNADSAYSWHDATPGRNFGRGLLHCGYWRDDGAAPDVPRFRPMTASSRARLPLSLWNRASGTVANALVLHSGKRHGSSGTRPLFTTLFPFAGNPWFHRFFGRPGLREVQLVLDDDKVDAFLGALEKLVRDTRPPTLMMSLKRFRGRQASLGPTGTGYLVAMDCYVNGSTARFLSDVDRLSVEYAAQPHPCKDSRLPLEVVRQCVRSYNSFRDALLTYDSERLLRSELSGRIGLQ